jgi:nitric oxide reductase subunit B
MQQPTVALFRWLRVPGDSLFALGALALAWFVFTLRLRWHPAEAGAIEGGA